MMAWSLHPVEPLKIPATLEGMTWETWMRLPSAEKDRLRDNSGLPASQPAKNIWRTKMQTEQITACGTLQPPFVAKVDLCRRWVTEVLEAVEAFDDVYDTNVSEVENRARDGFIPFTDGGFDGIGYATLGYAHGSGAAPSVIQPYLDSAIKDAEKEWDEQNPEHTVAWIYADDDVDQLTLPGVEKSREREHWREKWYEFEDTQLSEGGTYFYKVRVLFHGDRHSSESGEPEALFCVGINTDFEYGRDSIPWLRCYGQSPNCTSWVWEKTVKVADLTEEMVEAFIEEAGKALADA